MLVAFGAFGLGLSPQSAEADVTGVWWMDSYGIPDQGAVSSVLCDVGDPDGDVLSEINEDDTLVLQANGGYAILCVNAEEGAGDLSFDSDDYGEWNDPSCDDQGDADEDIGELEDECVNELGEGTDLVQIPDDDNDLGIVFITFDCDDDYGRTLVTIEQEGEGEFEFWIECRHEATAITLTAAPDTVEIAPARSNTSHSLITLTAVDGDGKPAYAGDVLFDDVDDDDDDALDIIDGYYFRPEIDFTTDLCSIEESGVDTEYEFEQAEGLVKALNTAAPGTYFAWEFSSAAQTSVDSSGGVDTTNPFYVDGADGNLEIDRTVAAVVLGCNPVDFKSWVPGVAEICATYEKSGTDLVECVEVTVIGPPAAVVVEASPTDLTCGEKSTITVSVKDSIGQNVSDHTRVEIITNLGGVLGGTGAAAGFALPVTPISSTAADTFGGVATAFLLTSNAHAGPYEVLATAGGTAVSDGGFSYYGVLDFFSVDSISELSTSYPAVATYLGGVFSTPPITAQVTVSCSLPAPAPAATITAPDTGTGITPPNTGDGGLLSEQSGSGWLLLALAGSAVAMALAGLTFKVARR